MSQSKVKNRTLSHRAAESPADQSPTTDLKYLGNLSWLLWAVFFVGPLFLIPQCLDRYLAPRFLFVSIVLLVGVLLRFWGKSSIPKFSILNSQFSILLLAWYALNMASVSWAFSWSEGVFYAQKVSLLIGVYVLLLAALCRDEAATRRILRRITVCLTWAAGGIVLGQLVYAGLLEGLQNEQLYEYASGVFGNKSLAAEFLFFLLIFNALFFKANSQQPTTNNHTWLRIGFLVSLILLLQTRTVYLALGAGALVYFFVRAAFEPAFRSFFLKKILPVGVLAVGLLVALLAMKGRGTSLAERLNPLTYLESTSANERRFVWYKTDLLNQDHYWWGVGNGSWKFWFPSKSLQGGYRLQEENVVFTRAHNDYLEVRSEMGMVGVLLYCGLFVWVFVAGIWAGSTAFTPSGKGAFTPKNSPNIAVNGVSPDGVNAVLPAHDLLVLLVGLLGYCIIQFFDFPRERVEMQTVLAFFFAYIAWHCREVGVPRGVFSGKKMPLWGSRLLLMIASLVLIFNVLVGWSRVTGEIHAVRMLEAQSKGDYRMTIHEANAAMNRFNEYDDTGTPLAWYAGVAQYQMGSAIAAVGSFREAYRLNPWSFQVMNNYASALLKTEKFQEAVPLLEKAVATNPKFDDGKFNLAYAYFQLTDYPRALDWLARVDTLPNPQTEEQQQLNRVTQTKQTQFRSAILEKME